MAQFDVYRIAGYVLVLDCQSDTLDDLKTRFAVPLRPLERAPIKRLHPLFEVDGETLVMVTHLARGIDCRDINSVIGNLAAHEYEIKAALDMLIRGY